MPVFPLVGSSRRRPGSSSPDASAASSIAFATRSLIEPVGFCPSSFANRRTDGFGESRGSSTSGVDPTRSRSDAGSALTATGHRRQEDQLVAVAHLGVEPVARADVLAAHVDVHEVARARRAAGAAPRAAGSARRGRRSRRPPCCRARRARGRRRPRRAASAGCERSPSEPHRRVAELDVVDVLGDRRAGRRRPGSPGCAAR